MVRRGVLEVALDWLAVGLDPEESHFVIESHVPEHAELTVWLSWWISLGRLERNPTLKAEIARARVAIRRRGAGRVLSPTR